MGLLGATSRVVHNLLQYPISLVKIDPLTLELMPLFSIGNYKAKPILGLNEICVVPVAYLP